MRTEERIRKLQDKNAAYRDCLQQAWSLLNVGYLEPDKRLIVRENIERTLKHD